MGIEDENIGANPRAAAENRAANYSYSKEEREAVLLEERIRSLRHEVDKLVDERPLLLAALRFQHAADLLKITLQVIFAFIGIVAVLALGGAIWSASHDNALVIESFSVPPDFSQRGLTGQVVAGQLLDRLAIEQYRTATLRAPSSYTNSWTTSDIKVAIPETGISIGELNRYLRDWLGHEVHITGEIYRTPTGIALTARASGSAGETYQGSEADFPKLLQKAAEYVYAHTQPYRYSVYLNGMRGRLKESDAVLRNMVEHGPKDEVKWGHLGLANSAFGHGDFVHTASEARAALALDPNFGMAYNLLTLGESNLGHDEAALDALNKGVAAVTPGKDPLITPAAAAMIHARMDAQRLAALGDYKAAAAADLAASELPDYNGNAGLSRFSYIEDLANQHDPRANDELNKITMADMTNIPQMLEYASALQIVPIGLGRWDTAAAATAMKLKLISNLSAPGKSATSLQNANLMARGFACHMYPLGALAFARFGVIKVANLYLAQTPDDCYLALRARGQVAAMEKKWSKSGYWFAQAVKAAPSIPFAYAEWGNALLAKGDYDGAIAKFAIAAQKGPHYADAMEGWGEALMLKNRSNLALAHFEAAIKESPNWSRPHLKLGEALWYLGRKADAAKQFDLVAAGKSTTDDAELAAFRKSHG